MEPFRAEYADQTTLHPAALLAIIVLGVATLLVRRRYAIMPILIMACFMAPAQRLVLFSLDFNLVRVILLFGWTRVLLHGEHRGFRWHPLDYVLLTWVSAGTLTYTLLHGSTSALVNRLGTGYDAVGAYFLFRVILRQQTDIVLVCRTVALLAAPVMLVFLFERATGRNAFSFLGGVPEVTMVRHGKLRCQGPFPHAIMAGCFWISWLPLIAALWWHSARDRQYAAVGLISIAGIVVNTASSTPLAVAIAVTAGIMFFPQRHLMPTMRWTIAGVLFVLHLVMNQPVWHLVSRIDLVGGSTGYHRYNLINQAIERFDEWMFIGTKSTVHWGWGLRDVTNQYVLEAVRGGAITLVLFIATIWLAFRSVSRLLCRSSQNVFSTRLAWALGVMLFAHCFAFIAVSYFGQIMVIWYLSLAMIAVLTTAKCRAHLNCRHADDAVYGDYAWCA